LLKRVEDNGGDTGRIMGSERGGGRRLAVDSDVIGSEENLWLFLLGLRVFINGGVLSIVGVEGEYLIPALYPYFRDDITVTRFYSLFADTSSLTLTEQFTTGENPSWIASHPQNSSIL